MPDKPQAEAPTPESMAPDYVHYDKVITPGPLLKLGPRHLKWYDIATAERPVPIEIHAMARAFLARQNTSDLSNMGFVILHRCGQGFYFLIACSWRGNNELWESVWAKDSADGDFRDWPRPGSHQPTYCVWEMGAVLHEQQVWMRFLRTRRDEKAVSGWLSDQYEGPV
jgi:hypothetical protein